MPENQPAIALCPHCQRPLFLPPGFVGAACPGHGPGVQSLPGNLSGSSQSASVPETTRAPGTGRPGGEGVVRPPRPPVTPLPATAEPEGKAKEEFEAWVAGFKGGSVRVEEKAHFFRLLDAMKAAGVRGKVREAIDQVPAKILYPVLLEIGALKPAGGFSAVQDSATPPSGEGPGGEHTPPPGPCGVEGCVEGAVNWRKTAAGIPTPVCAKHTKDIDERRKASAERNRAVK
jgi:hypothetical protein